MVLRSPIFATNRKLIVIMVYEGTIISSFIKCGIYRLQAAKENYHLIANALPYTHYRNGRKCLICTVNERLCFNSYLCKHSVKYSLRAVYLHPEVWYYRKGHYNGNEECYLIRKYGKLPDDYKIVGFDNTSISREAVIPISTVGQQIETMANEAMELLLLQINERKKRNPVPLDSPIHKTVTPILYRRDTTG